MEQATPDEVTKMLPLVSEQRRCEALQFKHTFGQFACLKTYLMLHQMLVEMNWIKAGEDLLFERNEHGKPSLKEYPHIHFNISHCPNALAVAVDNENIGVDIERFHPFSPALLNYTMSPAEIESINQSPAPEQTFTAYWTQKEALFKYLGTGIRGDIPLLLNHVPTGVQLHTKINEAKGYAITLASKKESL